MTTADRLAMLILRFGEKVIDLIMFVVGAGRPRRACRIVFNRARFERERIEIKGEIMSLILTDTQKVTLSISPVDARGNPAPLGSTPEWASSDPAVLEVTAAADGLSAIARAIGPLGTSQVQVSADADLGEGVTTITGTLDVEVRAGQAVALGINAGAVEEQ